MTTVWPARVVDLDDLSVSGPERFGTKAAVLARLRCERLPVPDGVAAGRTSALREWAAVARILQRVDVAHLGWLRDVRVAVPVSEPGHHGDLSVESEPGDACFRSRIPIAGQTAVP